MENGRVWAWIRVGAIDIGETEQVEVSMRTHGRRWEGGSPGTPPLSSQCAPGRGRQEPRPAFPADRWHLLLG
jgi:hypothetical protein